MFVDVGHFDFIPATHFEHSVARLGFAELRGDRPENQPHIAANREAVANLLVATRYPAANPHSLTRFEDGEVGIFDFHKESLAGLQLDGLGIVAGQRRANAFQGGDRSAVMRQLEVAQSDVVVGLVDLSAHRELFDHIPHDLEALAVVPRMVRANAHLQRRRRPLVVIAIVLGRNLFEVGPRSIIRAIAIQVVVPKTQMGVEPQTAFRIAFDDRLPDLDRLGGFVGLQSGVTGLDQLLGRPILNDRPAGRRSARIRLDLRVGLRFLSGGRQTESHGRGEQRRSKKEGTT